MSDLFGNLDTAMRDDSHKSAPVSRAWRSFMRDCAREADRKQRAANSALRAITNDCSRELSPKFMANIAEQMSRAQGTLFGSALDMGRRNADGHVLEKEVMANLRRREACGQSGAGAIKGALTDAVTGRL